MTKFVHIADVDILIRYKENSVMTILLIKSSRMLQMTLKGRFSYLAFQRSKSKQSYKLGPNPSPKLSFNATVIFVVLECAPGKSVRNGADLGLVTQTLRFQFPHE